MSWLTDLLGNSGGAPSGGTFGAGDFPAGPTASGGAIDNPGLPSQKFNWGNALQILGATLKDVGNQGKTDNVGEASKAIQAHQQFVLQALARQNLGSALGSYTAPSLQGVQDVNVSPQIAGSGMPSPAGPAPGGGSVTGALPQGNGSQPATPAGLSNFNYGGAFGSLSSGGYDPDKIKAAVMSLIQSGNTDAAMQVMNLNKPKDPQVVGRDSSLVQAQPDGSYKTLFDNKEPQAQVLKPDEIAALGLPKGTVAQRDKDGKISTIGGAGARPNPVITGTDAQAAGLDPTRKWQLGENNRYQPVDEPTVFRNATPKEVADAGLPTGTVARINDKTKEMTTLYTPPKDTGENLQAPTQIGFTGPDGEEVQTAASFNRKTGRYSDAATGKEIVNPQNLRVIGNATGGARSAGMVDRVLTNAEDATSGIENLSGINSKGTTGLFRNLETSPLSALSRTVTPQEVQDVKATMAGLGRAMAGLATGGQAVDKDTQESYAGLELQAGDSEITKMRKLAELRQQSTNALDVKSVSPSLTPAQKKKAADLSARIKAAVPWTVQDVQDLENSSDPNISMRDLAQQKLGKGSTTGAGTSKTINGVTYHLVNGQWMQ